VAELVITCLLTGKDVRAAADYIAAGATASGGELPVNPAGGRIGIGHPVGATGVRMLVENYLQHARQAGENQVGKADVGITVNFGGPYGVSLAFVTRLADI
jgi:acetyl-CoA C-acetyltransferase